MPTIHFIDPQGGEHALEAQAGDNLMQLALDNMVPGIDADCGGLCACGTCHVFVEQGLENLGDKAEMEQTMINSRPDKLDSSRLSCQVTISDAMDGLTLRIPEFQM
ncbi:MAG: 2Fe-2S iron-sulfur cluster-binding protein [Cellvibrionaceae bacterium]|nr:2Fe-2S iron-sulfur cluster-binding protein [Cellvibrionaceae bacterium]